MNQTQLTREELEPYRSKLYSLNGDNGWIDQGTGFPMITEGDGETLLKFTSEETGNVVYQTGINIELQFDFQDEKIFTWYNQQTNVDMALSFQNEAAAQTLWDKISHIIQKQNRDIIISAFSHADNRMEEPHLTIPQEHNLPLFESELASYTTGKIDRKNTICQILCQKREYLNNLIGVFRSAELNKDIEKLTLLFKIFRQMINLAHYELYQVLLSDEYYLEVFGALEYDPERMVGKSHPSHRGYFQNYASLKEIGQIKDPEVLRTIHWNIRLLYLRDCVLAHYLDERILQFLSAIVNSNYVDILKYIQSSREVMSAVFELLRQRKLNALKMIHEICLTMKNLDVDKFGIYEEFAEFNMFETLEEIMVRPNGAGGLGLKKKDNKKKESISDEIDVKVHIHMILEILMLSLVQAPKFLREYCISQHQTVQKHPLLTYIFDRAINHEDPIIQNMLGEVIKHLIDSSEYEEVQIQVLFYERYLAKLLEIFDINSTEEKIRNAKSVVLDVLIYCSKQQMENLKKRIVPLDISGKIFRNFTTNDKFLIITIIQLYKLLLQCKDGEIVPHLAKPLDVIIDYFLKNCKNKTNLLHSSLLEVFVLIMKEELLPLINYIIENHKEFIQDEGCRYITEKIKEKQKKLTTGDSDKMTEEQKQNRYPFNLNTRRGRANLTIISPFGSALAVDMSESSRRVGPISTMSIENNSPAPVSVVAGTEEKINSGNGSPVAVGSPTNNDKDLKRTSSNIAKIVDYDDEMEFNMETRGKDMNFLLEDIQLKKRKMDDLTAVNILNK